MTIKKTTAADIVSETDSDLFIENHFKWGREREQYVSCLGYAKRGHCKVDSLLKVGVCPLHPISV